MSDTIPNNTLASRYNIQDLLDAHQKYDSGYTHIEQDFFDEMWHLIIKAARRGKQQVNHPVERRSLSPHDATDDSIVQGLFDYLSTQLALISANGFVCRLYNQHPSVCLCGLKTHGCLAVFEVRWNRDQLSINSPKIQ